MERFNNILAVMGIIAVLFALIFAQLDVFIIDLPDSFIYIPLGVFAGCGALIVVVAFVRMLFTTNK